MTAERSEKPPAGAPRIAVLEDDASQAKLVQHWLAAQGLNCRMFERGEEILKALLRDTYDLVILDWRVPDLSGEEVLKAVRKNVREPLPVLFTTGRDREEDIVYALRIGADDYLIKPLRRMEFLARVDALLRRSRGLRREGDDIIEAGGIRIDTHGRTVLKDGVQVDLTHKEFEMAAVLFRNVGRLMSRAYLLDTVWGIQADVSTRTVDTHASQLRSKLGLYPESGWRLSSIYQHGYRMERVTPARAAEEGKPAAAAKAPAKAPRPVKKRS
jgi:two-component system response regulator RegX3